MNPLIQDLIKQATYTVKDANGVVWGDNVNSEKLAQLVARRCIQVALDWDDPILAVEMADLFGITK